MSYTLKSFLIGATALAAFGSTATLTAFSATKPDAPQVIAPQAKPVTVTVEPNQTPKRATKRTRVIIRRADRAQPTGLKVVVIDEPDVQKGTISVVTENDEFATIATGMGTRIARGYQLAGLNNIHPGYTLRCQGAWDQDGFQYQASRISLGETVKDTDVIARVNAACENIGKARKGGGFGQSLVAMIPRSPTSQAVSIGGRPFATPTPPATPIPEDLVAPENTAPSVPSTVPIDPSTVPAVPSTNPPAPLPVVPQGQPE